MRNVSNAIQEHKDKVLEHYVEKEVLGIFVYGSQNYGTHNANSDVDTKAILIPSFEDLCLRQPVSKELHLPNDEHCEVKDIRELVKMFEKQNINFLEILYTPYCWINPLYEEVWKDYFLEYRDRIVHFDENKAIQSICGQAIHTLKQDPRNGKKVSNGYRLKFYLEDYLQNKPYLDCIFQPQERLGFLKQLKSINELASSEQGMALISAFEELKYKSVEVNGAEQQRTREKMEQGLMTLIKVRMDFDEHFN